MAVASRSRIVGTASAFPALVFLALFFCVPVAEILFNSIYGPDGRIGMEQFERLAGNAVYTRVLGMTFLISLLTAVGSVAIGYPVAYFLSRLPDRSRGRWLVWLLIPFWTSYLVKTFAWILLLSRTGVLGTFLAWSGLNPAPPALAPSMGAVLAGMIHGMLPLAVMTMLPIMQGIGKPLTLAAETLGASRIESFFTIYLPLSMPGVAAAGLLVFITSLGFFIVPALLGTPAQTMIAQLVISAILELFNVHFAGALSVVLLVCAIAVFLLYDRLVGLSTLGGGDTPRPPGTSGFIKILVLAGRWADRSARAIGRLRPARPAQAPGGPDLRRFPGLRAYAWCVMLVLLLPVAVILPIAFTDSSFLAFPPQGFSLRWLEGFFSSPIWRAALLRSLGVATLTAIGAVVLGFGAALALVRLSPSMAKATFAFLIAPLIVPRIVTAVGLFYLFSRIGLAGTDAGLVIGHMVLAIPYVVVTMAAALKNFDWRLIDAAYTLGAPPMKRLTTVMLPLLKPSLIASFLFAFLVSFDELTIAIFVSGGLKTTLPKQMWDDMLLAANPTLAAVSFVLVAAITVFVLLLSLTRRDRGQ
ncbi:ABC transporter permease subunit [Bordetella flabilis]|uniref:ABC transporter permease n=1 Tax=Bordetella flabilis TaxID=463014 RepID=A0A193G8Z7_9BORD|nr:ABC transporter permease subunit [Bordetella flabilis]ANN76133.1 ABC transporter permease [Bordetella flabilis]